MRPSGKFPKTSDFSLLENLEEELVSRNDRSLEARFIYAYEVVHRLVIRFLPSSVERQYRCRLGEGLDGLVKRIRELEKKLSKSGKRKR